MLAMTYAATETWQEWIVTFLMLFAPGIFIIGYALRRSKSVAVPPITDKTTLNDLNEGAILLMGWPFSIVVFAMIQIFTATIVFARFFIPDSKVEATTFIVGIIVNLLSWIALWVIRRRIRRFSRKYEITRD